KYLLRTPAPFNCNVASLTCSDSGSVTSSIVRAWLANGSNTHNNSNTFRMAYSLQQMSDQSINPGAAVIVRLDSAAGGWVNLIRDSPCDRMARRHNRSEHAGF